MTFFDRPLGNLPLPPRPRVPLARRSTLVAQVRETRRITITVSRNRTMELPVPRPQLGVFQ